jgi:hypothetical protein
MRRYLLLVAIVALTFTVAGCRFRVFVSDTRLRGPVPDPTQMAIQAEAIAQAQAAATPVPATTDATLEMLADLRGRVGEDLNARNAFSGRETPRAGPMRGMRVEPGDIVRLSSSRSQETATLADEYCVEQGTRCSNLWVYGRPGGRPQGAWYPIVIFDYAAGE